MKLHEILSSYKNDLTACKEDLMTKVAMDEKSAKVVAESMREMFLPKLFEKEGLEVDDLPKDLIGKMVYDDEDFENETPDDEHDICEDEDEIDGDEDEIDEDEDGDHEDDAFNDEFEVSDDEIATIHISVPADKIREVEKALEIVLGDTDADSMDHANVHKNKKNIGDNDMDKKQLEARKALRKTILAAVQDDEFESVSHRSKFDYANSEQYREEDRYPTMKFEGGSSDPELDSLDYADQNIPVFSDLLSGLEKDLGLSEFSQTKFDGAPEDTHEYQLEFNPFEVPSQGNEDLYTEAPIPTERELSLKRTVNSSSLGEFDTEEAEEALAYALRSAGVDDEDLAKITYAEALELFKAIRTAGNYASEDHKDMKDEAKDCESEDAGEVKHGENTYSEMLAKLLKKDDLGHKKSQTMDMEVPLKVQVTKAGRDKEDHDHDHAESEEKKAELYKARLKTSYACSSKLALAGILPNDELDSYAEGMLADGLTVTSMIKQTKLMLANAAAHAEKLAASGGKNTRVASTGITFNPTVRTASNSDLSGALDIQNALRNIGWTTAKVDTEMEG
jgi:hypothetical protein